MHLYFLLDGIWGYALLHALNIMDKKDGKMYCIISMQDALELWPMMQNKLLLI